MLEFWSEDRIASKAALQPQKLKKKAYSTQYKVEFAEKIWNVFCTTHGLRFTDKNSPDVTALIRLAAVLVNRLRPGEQSKLTPSVLTIRSHMVFVLNYLVFTYFSFKWTQHGILRLESFLNAEVASGRLTRDLWRKREWVGATLVTQAIRTYLETALT